MKRVHLDFETRSLVDIKKTGAYKYAEHPSTSILCLVYRIGGGERTLWTPDMDGDPEDLIAAAQDPEFEFMAHNAFFERWIWHFLCVKRMLWPAIARNRWRCSAAKASAFALPRALADAGKALKLDTVKDEEGKRVMLKMSRPRKPTKKDTSLWHTKQEDLDRVYEYCGTDVASEEAIDARLPDLRPMEQRVWELDQKINDHGVYIDKEAVDAALYLLDIFNKDLNDELNTLTMGIMEEGTEVEELLNWLNARGVNIDNMQKDTLAAVKKDPTVDARCIRAIEIRQAIGKTSTAKYKRFRTSMSEDCYIRDILMYHAASTGRWGGRLVQFQNVPPDNFKKSSGGKITNMNDAIALLKTRNVDKILNIFPQGHDFLSQCLRGMVISPPGKKMIVVDYSAIEARVLFWVTECLKGVEVFTSGQCIYRTMAGEIYKINPLDAQKLAKDGPERKLGKTAILGLGYQMGAPKFTATCSKQGIEIEEEFAKEVVKAYRSTWSEVNSYWYNVEKAAIMAVQTGKKIGFGKCIWFTDQDFLFCKLPSGRNLAYYQPEVRPTTTPWGSETVKLLFSGVDTYTKKWGRQSTYGGKLTENIVQAIARDLMAEAMLRLDEADFELCLSVHDEVVAYVAESESEELDKWMLEKFIHTMTELPAWAKGCPVTAEGWIDTRYRK